jgi:hypothetical protein
MTKLYSSDLDRWVRVGVLAILENGRALVRVLDGDRELFALEVPVYRLRAA